MSEITAKTEMFRRIQKWRIENGRDPNTGQITNAYQSGKSMFHRFDALRLVVVGLRVASQYGREDLRPLYRELAAYFESQPNPSENTNNGANTASGE